MLIRPSHVMTAALVVSLGMIDTATAQLGFTIDPTQGLPGIRVSGQVDPADVAEQCVTTVEGIQAEFEALFEGPFAFGNPEGEFFLRFFPSGDFVFDTCDQAAYTLTGFAVLGIANNLFDSAATALPQTFVMTFVDPATLKPIGELGHFDPVTGAGSVVVPDVAPGQWPVIAACVAPSLDLDVLEAGIRANGTFLESLGFPTCDVNSPEFGQYVEQLLGPGADIFTFLQAYGPTLIQSIVVPDALGLQLFTVLDQPQSKDECKKGGWQQFAGLGFRNQGDCIHFFNAGLHAGTTAAVIP